MTNSPELVKVKCEKCDGTGICSECEGRKKTKIGVLGEVEVVCPKCAGSGSCMLCNGEGDIWVQDNKPLY